MQDYTDQQLLQQYTSGDEHALEFLIQKYLTPVYRFVYGIVGNATDAEDITQETFVKMWKHIKTFDESKNFKTWLLSIAKHTAIDFLRKKKTIPFAAFEDEEGNNVIVDTMVDTSPRPDQLFEQKSLKELLARAVSQLSPKHLKVFSLRANDHLTFREIAEETHEPLDTVKSRYRRSLASLKKMLSGKI